MSGWQMVGIEMTPQGVVLSAVDVAGTAVSAAVSPDRDDTGHIDLYNIDAKIVFFGNLVPLEVEFATTWDMRPTCQSDNAMLEMLQQHVAFALQEYVCEIHSALKKI